MSTRVYRWRRHDLAPGPNAVFADGQHPMSYDDWKTHCVWFKCDPDKPTTKRRIAMVGTGDTAPEGARYIGTGFLYGGKLVLHVFERVNAVAQLSDL